MIATPTKSIKQTGRNAALLSAALDYARRGWAVFPVHSPEFVPDCPALCSCGKPDCPKFAKHPRNANGFLGATKDEGQIEEWWKQWPESNIGLATGAVSGFITLDIDPRNGGDESLAELIALHGPLPDTIESLTGGGGRHINFAHPGGYIACRNHPRSIKPGIDLKADGGYIILPPSQHKSGALYEWELSSYPGDVPFAPCPSWLLSYLQQKAPPKPSVNGQDKSNGKVPEGERNTFLVSLGGTMRRRGMTTGSIEAALYSENQNRCEPPLDEDEVRKIAQGMVRYSPDTDEHHTDAGNAKRLIAVCGEEFRHCHPWKKWLVWDDSHWRLDDTAAIARTAKQMIAGLYEQAGVLIQQIAEQLRDNDDNNSN